MRVVVCQNSADVQTNLFFDGVHRGRYFFVLRWPRFARLLLGIGFYSLQQRFRPALINVAAVAAFVHQNKDADSRFCQAIPFVFAGRVRRMIYEAGLIVVRPTKHPLPAAPIMFTHGLSLP